MSVVWVIFIVTGVVVSVCVVTCRQGLRQTGWVLHLESCKPLLWLVVVKYLFGNT